MDRFVDITNYEGLYKVNILGDVLNVKKGKCLKPCLNGCGYKMVGLCKNGEWKNKLIHRLIMLHFIPNPHNLPCVDHINRIKQDNRIENLRWSSQEDNSRNMKSVDDRKGHIRTNKYTSKKTGKITITYTLHYNNKGEYGKKYHHSKSFKTLEEAEAFRTQIYEP
jgi:hypothetical protein